MKTELDKCLAGEIFDTSAPEISKIIRRSRKLTIKYNGIAPEKCKKKRKLTSVQDKKVG